MLGVSVVLHVADYGEQWEKSTSLHQLNWRCFSPVFYHLAGPGVSFIWFYYYNLSSIF